MAGRNQTLYWRNFGDEDTLRQLIQGAHGGIRVLIDWLGTMYMKNIRVCRSQRLVYQ